MPREVERHGKVIYLATEEELRALQAPLVIDARSPAEVDAEDGGAKFAGSVNVPFFAEGSTEPPTVEQYAERLSAASALPAAKDAPIVTHCGGGGRGQKVADMLKGLGYTNVHNGGSADLIRAALAA
ncbi:hypothetical protein KFE25_003717 [Diacronema lutheri]|uniref:Rhodanese domain-containing protein n=1 Tax=Diacronema lutheri TaxID=2081491 RepID=A0A8J5X1U6_DIALT|nr:hypothetical protein KFE25_003717 [Diacronema lutheri]